MAFPTTSLLARYEAKLDTGHLDGDALATIPDQSGAGRSLTQGTSANRPTYRTGIVNGQPAYRLDGAGDCAQRAEALSLTAASLAVVLSSEPTEDPARSWPFGVYDSSASLPRIFAFTEAATAGEWGSFVRTSVTTLQQSTSGADTTGWTVLTLTWDGSTAKLYRNGSLVASGAIAGTLESINTLSLGALTANTFGGDVALAALYNTALDATARAALHTYVQDMYGVTVSDYTGAAPVNLGVPFDSPAGQDFTPGVAPGALSVAVAVPFAAPAGADHAPAIAVAPVALGIPFASADGVDLTPSVQVGVAAGALAVPFSGAAGADYAPEIVPGALVVLVPFCASDGTDYAPTLIQIVHGYLTGRVRMAPALSGAVAMRPALTGRITLTPADR